MARRLVALTDEDITVVEGSLFSYMSDHRVEADVISRIIKKLNASQKRIAVSSAKGKGRTFQMFVCRWISELLGIPYKQSDDACLIHSREMGQHGCDIILRGEARERFPFDIEAKAVKSLHLGDAVDQAESNAGEGRFGVVFYRQTTQKPLVIFSLGTFEKLCKRWLGGDSGNK